MPKVRRKKHSIVKRHANYCRVVLKQFNAVVVWVGGQNDNNCILVDAKNLKTINPEKALVGALSDVAHDWTVYCAAFGRRQDGQEYMKGDLVKAPRCFQYQISDQLNELHMNIVRSMNHTHRVGIGWIACPWGLDFSEEQAAKLFDKFGGWDAERLELNEVS